MALNINNLQPVRTKEEAKERGRNGGIKSGEARRAKRDAMKIAQQVIEYRPKLPQDMLDAMKKMGMKGSRPDIRLISTMAIAQKAMKGDIRAYNYLLVLAGEAPESELNEIRIVQEMRRAGLEEPEEASTDIFEVRRRMDSMTDDQLKHYEELCKLLAPEEYSAEPVQEQAVPFEPPVTAEPPAKEGEGYTVF